MQAFEFHSPTKIIFGTGTEDQTGRRVAEYGGSRVLVVYGGQSAVKSGLLDRIKASLEEAGLTYETLGGVTPNPRLGFARAGVEKAVAFGADFLLAVGGGSVIDAAKAISLLSDEGINITYLYSFLIDGKGVLIFRTDDAEKASAAIARGGLHLISEEALATLA